MIDVSNKITEKHNVSETSRYPSQNYSFMFEIPCEFDFHLLQRQDSDNPESKKVVKSKKNTGIEELVSNSINIDDCVLSNNKFATSLTEKSSLASGIIVEQICSGTNSQIYKIWNQDLEMFRVVKVCAESDLMHESTSRFLTEAKIAAQLRHPNIIEVYSTGKWNMVPYIEMEYIDGFSVGQIVKDAGALPVSTSCAIAIFVCRALLYAHLQEFTLDGKKHQGVIHRDLKPANIIISKKGNVKLLDFGIARPCDESLYETIASNKIVGTIQYLSPEQMDGSELDFRTDIYSFGAVLYEILSGHTTFPQTTLTSVVKAKVMNSYKSFSELQLLVPEKLQSVIKTCLEINRENRFSSLSELLSVLENYFIEECSGTAEENVACFISQFINKTGNNNV